MHQGHLWISAQILSHLSLVLPQKPEPPLMALPRVKGSGWLRNVWELSDLSGEVRSFRMLSVPLYMPFIKSMFLANLKSCEELFDYLLFSYHQSCVSLISMPDPPAAQYQRQFQPVFLRPNAPTSPAAKQHSASQSMFSYCKMLTLKAQVPK